ncbi:MAG: glycoside hydrolase family protein [Campylobacteraceae bacterium]|jgi:lysozyme|nr:glycoside hydrolase family protein [Campylobacteraceae bacterium]
MFSLIQSIKKHEGLRLTSYICPSGYPTIGYGTKLPLNDFEKTQIKSEDKITEQEAEFLLKHRLENSIKELNKQKPFIAIISENRKRVVYEMAYQLGVQGLLKFKRFFAALEKNEFKDAAHEMIESKWAKSDSPKRAGELALIMQLG